MASALDRLDGLDVLVADGQSAGASPAHGHLLELGWARTRAIAGEGVASREASFQPGGRNPAHVASMVSIVWASTGA